MHQPARSTADTRVRGWGRSVHDHRSWVADGAYALFVGLLVLLALLPTGVSATRQTISAYALTPMGELLRLAFLCLAIGSLLTAYEFWRSVPGRWGRALAGLTGLWVTGDIIDSVISVNPVGGHTVHGAIHAVVAVVAFSAVAATVLTFLGWLYRHAPQPRLAAAAASVLALVTVGVELGVTLTSATFVAGTAERIFFVGALVWMITARRAVATSVPQPVTWPPGSAIERERISVADALAWAGAGLLAVVTVLLVLLAALPGRRPFLADTVSSSAYGPHAGLVFAVLLLFGAATAALASSLGLRLTGAAGALCAALVGVWAVAAVFDAFVRTTSSTQEGTAFGQVHTMMAVAGIAAQGITALVLLEVVRRRAGRFTPQLVAATSLVLAGIVFVAVHPDSLAGLSERMLLAASAFWMLTSVHQASSVSPDRTR